MAFLLMRQQPSTHAKTPTHFDKCQAVRIHVGSETLASDGGHAELRGPRLVFGRWMGIHLVSLQCLTYL